MHSQAMLAAEASMEAFAQRGNDGFWAFHDLAFARQQDLSRDTLEQIAQQIGLSMPSFRAALGDHRHQARVEADAKAARDAGFTGTPTFLVNDYLINGAQPLSAFERVIERALQE
jgi:predicted DsbA family dithiol-disulfide isomerase